MKYIIENDLLLCSGLIVCESAVEVEINFPNKLELYKEKVYGNKKVSIYRKRGD